MLESLGIKIPILIAQIIGLLILFFGFRYFIGNKLQKSIEERRSLMRKLEDADAEYKKILQEAQNKADEIFANAEKQKKLLISEGKELSEKKQNDIINKANQEAKILIENAKTRAEKLGQDLEKEFENSVKTIANKVIKKLTNKEVEIKKEYIKEITKAI